LKVQTALIIGVGYVGIRLIKKFAALGFNIYGSSRNKENLDKLNNLNIIAINWDKQIIEYIDKNNIKPDFIISTVPPDKNGNDPILEILHGYLDKFDGWIGYISSTSVYGGINGVYINEKSKCNPNTQRGQRRLSIEVSWQNLGAEIFRVSGIYGEYRSPFEKLYSPDTILINKTKHLFNRIHVDDLVEIITSSTLKPETRRIVNVADGNPSSQIDFFKEASRIANTAMPKVHNYNEVEMSDFKKSFWKDWRFIKPDVALNELKYKFIYPDYKSGLKAIWDLEKKRYSLSAKNS
jgi:hypothetical protein